MLDGCKGIQSSGTPPSHSNHRIAVEKSMLVTVFDDFAARTGPPKSCDLGIDGENRTKLLSANFGIGGSYVAAESIGK